MIFDEKCNKSELVNTPEGKIFIGILLLALVDLTKKENISDIRKDTKKNAIRWILEGNEVLRIICWLTDINIKTIQNLVYDKNNYEEIYNKLYLFLIGKKKK